MTKTDSSKVLEDALADEKEPERFDNLESNLSMGKITTIQSKDTYDKSSKRVKFVIQGEITVETPSGDVKDIKVKVELEGDKPVTDFVMNRLGIIEIGDPVYFNLDMAKELKSLDKAAIKEKKKSANVIESFFVRSS